jgi:hypothetical protein
MGWPVFAVVVLGVVAASLRVSIDLLDKVFRRELVSKSMTPEMIPLVFIAVFFLATGYFQVKFPRYLLPLYPMLFIFAASLFAPMFRAPATKRATASPAGHTRESEKLVSSKPLLAPVDVSRATPYSASIPVEHTQEEPVKAESEAVATDDTPSEK